MLIGNGDALDDQERNQPENRDYNDADEKSFERRLFVPVMVAIISAKAAPTVTMPKHI